MEWLLPTRCAGCGRLHAGLLCAECRPRGIHRPPVHAQGVSGCMTLGHYDGPLGRAVRQCKASRDRHLARAIARVFARRVPRIACDAVVWVPTPWTRRWARGFHLAAILAQELGGRQGIPIVAALHARLGPAQSKTASRRSRRQNLRGRIRSVRPVPGRVLLVDDVITSGATVEACARELLGDSTETVWVASVCAVRRHRETPSQDL